MKTRFKNIALFVGYGLYGRETVTGFDRHVLTANGLLSLFAREQSNGRKKEEEKI